MSNTFVLSPIFCPMCIFCEHNSKNLHTICLVSGRREAVEKYFGFWRIIFDVKNFSLRKFCCRRIKSLMGK